jgi:hypothetical protein
MWSRAFAIREVPGMAPKSGFCYECVMSARRVGPVVVVSLSVALGGLSVACGGGGAKPAGDGGGDAAAPDGDAAAEGPGPVTGPETALEFCTAFRELQAAYAARCNGGTKEEWAVSGEAYVTCAQFAERIGAGRVGYRRTLAQACLDSFGPQRSCDERDNLCFAKVLEGTLGYGKPCRSDFDCPAEGVCWPADELAYNACAVSVCTRVPTTVGEPCAALGFCFGFSCIGDQCAAPTLVGEACGDDLPGCAQGTTCDPDTAKCVPRKADGPCGRDRDCLLTHACIGAACKPRIALGASCIGAETACATFTACNPESGKCEAAGHPGQQCAGSNGDFFICIGGVCRADAFGVPTCYAKGEVGAECGGGDECVSEGCDNGTCKICGV